MKHDWKPGTMIYPLPAVMVSCGSEPSEYNIIHFGTNTHPPADLLYIRPSRAPLLSDPQKEHGICD